MQGRPSVGYEGEMNVILSPKLDLFGKERLTNTQGWGHKGIIFFIMNVVILFSFCSEQLSRQQEGYPQSH